MESQAKNKINHLSIVFSGVSSVSGLGRGGGQERLKLPNPHSEILWFPSPRGGRRGHGDGKPQLIKGLVLLGLMGTARVFWWAA